MAWQKIGAAALVLAAGVCAALAGDVDIKKDRDSHVTVWRTLLGFRIGDPVYDGTLPGGHRLRVRSSWLTDLSVTQDLLVADQRVEYQIASFDSPTGVAEMVDLEPWLRDRLGKEVFTIVDFLPGPLGPPHDLFVGISLDHCDPFPPTEPLGTIVPVIHGMALGYQGYQFSRMPFVYLPAQGWVNEAPFDGQIQIAGEITLNAEPYLPNGCNWADIAEPFGVLDLADINAFIAAFVGGCPPDVPD